MNCKNMMKRLGAILICASLMCTINVANVFAETNENVDIRIETAELTAEPTETPEESYPPVPEIRESDLNKYQLREWKEEWSDVEKYVGETIYINEDIGEVEVKRAISSLEEYYAFLEEAKTIWVEGVLNDEIPYYYGAHIGGGATKVINHYEADLGIICHSDIQTHLFNDLCISINNYLVEHPELFFIWNANGMVFLQAEGNENIAYIGHSDIDIFPFVEIKQYYEEFGDGEEFSKAVHNLLHSKIDELQTEVKAIAEEINAKTDNQFEKIGLINSYVTKNCYYLSSDETKGWQQTSYAVVNENRAVCEGYAMLFRHLLIECGFNPEDVVRIEKFSPDYHVWLGVRLNDKWYHIDPTYSDIGDYTNNAEHLLVSEDHRCYNLSSMSGQKKSEEWRKYFIFNYDESFTTTAEEITELFSDTQYESGLVWHTGSNFDIETVNDKKWYTVTHANVDESWIKDNPKAKDAEMYKFFSDKFKAYPIAWGPKVDDNLNLLETDWAETGINPNKDYGNFEELINLETFKNTKMMLIGTEVQREYSKDRWILYKNNVEREVLVCAVTYDSEGNMKQVGSKTVKVNSLGEPTAYVDFSEFDFNMEGVEVAKAFAWDANTMSPIGMTYVFE